MKKYTIKLNFDFSGEYLGIRFSSGVGETTESRLADKCRRKGYSVTEEDIPEPVSSVAGIPSSEGDPVLEGLNQEEQPTEPIPEAEPKQDPPAEPSNLEEAAQPVSEEIKPKKNKSAKE